MTLTTSWICSSARDLKRGRLQTLSAPVRLIRRTGLFAWPPRADSSSPRMEFSSGGCLWNSLIREIPAPDRRKHSASRIPGETLPECETHLAKSPDSPSPVHRSSHLDGISEPWDARLMVVPFSRPRSAGQAETPDSESPVTITSYASHSFSHAQRALPQQVLKSTGLPNADQIAIIPERTFRILRRMGCWSSPPLFP